MLNLALLCLSFDMKTWGKWQSKV